MHGYKTKVKLFQTDAAGKLFFSNLFMIAHECYENYFYDNQIKISDIIRKKKFLISIVHAEADYVRPIFNDEILFVLMEAEKIGNRSYTLNFNIKKQNGKQAAKVTTVHVTSDYSSGKSIVIPKDVKRIISKLSS